MVGSNLDISISLTRLFSKDSFSVFHHSWVCISRSGLGFSSFLEKFLFFSWIFEITSGQNRVSISFIYLKNQYLLLSWTFFMDIWKNVPHVVSNWEFSWPLIRSSFPFYTSTLQSNLKFLYSYFPNKVFLEKHAAYPIFFSWGQD